MTAVLPAELPVPRTAASAEPRAASDPARVVLSFDVEEHHRIESAAGLSIDPFLQGHYRARMQAATEWLLEELDRFGTKATFFVVGEIARSNPGLVRAMQEAGHEVGSHGWDHRRVHHFTPASFAEDLRTSKDALEQVTGRPVLGYRAPTFSIVRHTAWAIDVLAEQGFLYDSSVFPVRHDRYGVPGAPRAPFRAAGEMHEILEFPIATLKVLGVNLPVGGGGYFRLLPLFFLEHALGQVRRHCQPSVAMLYFHPWEFDPEQARLPLRSVNRFRTYVGISRTRSRLSSLLRGYQFTRAVDAARRLRQQWLSLTSFRLAG